MYLFQEVSVEPESKERLAGSPGGSNEEAQQVKQFLDKEHEKFQKVDTSSSPPPEIEVWDLGT